MARQNIRWYVCKDRYKEINIGPVLTNSTAISGILRW